MSTFDRNFISLLCHENLLYWITERNGVLMRLNTQTLVCDYITPKCKCDCSKSHWCSVLIERNDIIYAMADGGNYLIIFDVRNNSIDTKYIGLKKYNLHDYASVHLIENEIAIISYMCTYLIRINVLNGNYYFDKSIYDTGKTDYLFAGVNTEDSGNIWGFQSGGSKAFCQDIYSRKTIEYDIKGLIYASVYVCQFSNSFYILDERGNVYSWKIGNARAELVFESDNKKRFYQMGVIHVVRNKLWLLPAYGEDILIYDLTTGRVEKFTDYPKNFSYKVCDSMAKYTRCVKMQGKIYFAMHTGNYIFMIDSEGEGHFLNVSWPTIKDEYQQLIKREEPIDEKLFSLKEFICCI